MSSQTVNLDYAIKVGGVDATSLTMRRPLVRDMLKARNNKNEGEAELNLFSDLCQITPDEVKSLDFADYAKLQEVLRDFTSSKSPTAV